MGRRANLIISEARRGLKPRKISCVDRAAGIGARTAPVLPGQGSAWSQHLPDDLAPAASRRPAEVRRDRDACDAALVTCAFGDGPVRLVHGSGTTPQQDMEL